MTAPPKPILFIAFANDLENPERNLGGLHSEFDNIHAAFSSVTGADDSCELLVNDACTGESLVEPFYRNQVVIFHYAGHASPDSLLLQTSDGHNAPASRQRFEEFLALQSRLRLVFLNACMTREWAAALVSCGVCVVATSRCIEDSIAPKFANVFYNQIAQGRTIAEAFEVASKGCSSAEEHQQSLRGFAAAENDHATDGLPWALYGSEAARRWKLADDADDPTIGLPKLDPAKYPPPAESPYVTIEGHQATDALIFFGRNGEIRQLWDWVMNPASTPVLLFYGQSGAGKSSLLRAGLQPRLDGIGKVQYARRGQDLSSDLETAIGAAGGSDAGWLGSDQPSLIVLDQAEEAITQGADGEMDALADRLRELFARRPSDSKARLILSFRKEYLAEIETLMKARLPELTTHLFLETLSHKAIRQVVLGPVRSAATRDQYHLRISGEFAEFLANRLQNSRGSVATVLQIVLRRMWEEGRKLEGKNGPGPLEFTDQLYFQVIDDQNGPLQQFLSEQVNRLREYGWPSAVDGGLELDLLLEHTTDHVTARRRSYEELQAIYPGRDQLQKLLEENKRLHLLTEAQDDGAGARATILSHDQLAAVVRTEWNLSQLPGARARRIVENRARTWGGSKRGDLLDGADLRVVEHGLDQMRALDPAKHEPELLEASRRRRRQRRRAWILWPSVAAAVIGCFVWIALANQNARQQIRDMNQNAAHSLDQDNPAADAFASLLFSMQSTLEARDSWAFRVRPDNTLREAARVALQNALAAPHDSGRYWFDYWAHFGDVANCATAFDQNGRLLLRTLADPRLNEPKPIQAAFLDGARLPPEMLDQVIETGCNASSRLLGALGIEDMYLSPPAAGPKPKLDWVFDLKDATRIALSPDRRSAAFGSTGFLPEGSAPRDMTWLVLANLSAGHSVEIHPGVGIPVGLAYSPDSTLLLVTGPKGMVWLDSQSGSVRLRCAGNYGAVRFAKAGRQEFAAVVDLTLLNWPSIEFWKVPLSENPGIAHCYPFDFYQPSEYGGDYQITAVAFDKTAAQIGVGQVTGMGPSVKFYPIPSTLTGASLPNPRYTHPVPVINTYCTGCPPPRPASEMHEFPDPINGVYPLPSAGQGSERPLDAAVSALGVGDDRSAFAFLQKDSPVVRVWPNRHYDVSANKPLAADDLLATACSELNVYLNEDDRFRVNPAAAQGVDLHVIQAGCTRLPRSALSVAH